MTQNGENNMCSKHRIPTAEVLRVSNPIFEQYALTTMILITSYDGAITSFIKSLIYLQALFLKRYLLISKYNNIKNWHGSFQRNIKDSHYGDVKLLNSFIKLAIWS